MKALLPYGPILMKTKNIRKKSENVFFFFSKIKKTSGHMAQGNQEINLKEIHDIGSEIIDATDVRRTTDEF